MEAPALMKYGEVVRDLAARGGDWRFYDTQFRNLRQTSLKCLGVPPIGNFGYVRRILLIRVIPSTNQCPIIRRLLLPHSLFPGVFVGNFTGALPAKVAILSTNVSNVV